VILSAGVVIVRKEEGIWKYLFLRAYRNWDFPRGVVESGEDPLETAIREVKEEAGIEELAFRWGAVFRETAPYIGTGEKIARYYLAETTEARVVFSINPEIGMPEHHEYRWLTYDETKILAPHRLIPIIEWAHTILTEGAGLHS